MIRTLKEEDIGECLAIYNWYIANSPATFETEPLSPEAFQDRVHGIMKKYPWIVYEDEGKILGYAYLSAFNERAAYDWTCDLAIYLDHEARGRGIGSALMAVILDLAERDGYHCMTSIITEGNRASEHIHEKFGFKKLGFFPNVGYKNGKWLGVSYYIHPLCMDKCAGEIRNLSVPEDVREDPQGSTENRR